MTKDVYSELKDLLTIPQTLRELEKRQTEIEKKLALLIKTAGAPPVAVETRGRPAGKKTAPKAKPKGAPRGRRNASGAGKMSMLDLIGSVLKGRKTPMSIGEIHDAIVRGNLYTGKSTNLKRLVSVSLYRNPDKRFQREGRGKFKLA